MKKRYLTLESIIDVQSISTPYDWSKSFGNENPIDLEIGFGAGEFLVKQALENPEINFLGAERCTNRIYKTSNKLHMAEVPNVRLMEVDVNTLLERFVAPGTLRKVYCLFPCPWPKKSQVKYRLFSSRFLQLVNSRLIDDGTIQLVSDHKAFIDWVLEEAAGESGFSVDFSTIDSKFDTKFERKWAALGQQVFYQIDFQKTSHLEIPVKENIDMQVFHCEEFCPEKFSFQTLDGDVHINFLDFIMDSSQQKGMVGLVVSEEQLMQHLWVYVTRSSKGGWKIGLAKGSNVFPTFGVAKAVEQVYKSVKATYGK